MDRFYTHTRAHGKREEQDGKRGSSGLAWLYADGLLLLFSYFSFSSYLLFPFVIPFSLFDTPSLCPYLHTYTHTHTHTVNIAWDMGYGIWDGMALLLLLFVFFC